MNIISVSVNSPEVNSIDRLDSDVILSNKEKKELLAKFIKEQIRKANFKNKEFAELMNKKPSEVTKWLSGFHNFTIDTLFDIETALGFKIFNLAAPDKKILSGKKIIKVKLSGVVLNLPKYRPSLYPDTYKKIIQIKKAE